MLSVFKNPVLYRRFTSVSPKASAVGEEVVKTTVDTGKQLEERVAKMLRKRGHLNIKMNQRVKDRNGNWSEFDIVYGWPIRHYVECKNYSHPVKLEMVAKFKEVLRLHRIPRSRGLFVTTSTYTPRATTIGITCIDGAGLERLEATAATSLIIKCFILCMCGGGSYVLYNFLCHTESKRVKKWRESVDAKSRELTEQGKETIKEAGSAVIATTNEVINTVSDIVEITIDTVKEIEIDRIKQMEETTKVDEEEEWEVPSVWKCVTTIFWGLLGYST